MKLTTGAKLNHFAERSSPPRGPKRDWVVLLIVLLIASLGNLTFFQKLLQAHPVNSDNLAFIVAVFVVLVCVLNIVFQLLCLVPFTKISLSVLVPLSAMLAYFMDQFSVVIDGEMILNILKTDTAESFDLLMNIKFFLYVIFVVLLPLVLILRLKLRPAPIFSSLLRSGTHVLVSVIVAVAVIGVFNKQFASFFREEKIVRYYTNPTFFIYAATKLIVESSATAPKTLAKVGEDAAIREADAERELVIFVLGETARADRFSLNGYARETNPRLSQQPNVVSFPDVKSCGTSTAASVPCMFSGFHRATFDHARAAGHENVLDVLSRTGKVNILWRDNNSDSKGVALRVPFEDFRTEENNPVCDVECRDVGMLSGLDDYIKAHPTGDILIMLHQMGSHGPAYYKRYPKEFEQFTPTCQTNVLSDCSDLEISNTYDNTIFYTDYFLDSVIEFLKPYSQTFETTMVYFSDHGESLGEGGFYLHGVPYALAPAEQKQVGAIFWFGGLMLDDIDMPALRHRALQPHSHDNIFHTLLGLMEVKTQVYDPVQDIIKQVEK